VFPEGDDAEADFLNGGEGDDTLTLGAGDYATGGEGSDDFVLSQWLGEGGHATISDYNADEDQIVVVYDASAHADPELTLAPVDGTSDVTIMLNGAPVGVVSDGAGMDLSDITLLAA
jgi:Ca2+-binding RTX toxin-like protein